MTDLLCIKLFVPAKGFVHFRSSATEIYSERLVGWAVIQHANSGDTIEAVVFNSGLDRPETIPEYLGGRAVPYRIFFHYNEVPADWEETSDD